MKKIRLSWKKIRNKFGLLSFAIVPVVGASILVSYNHFDTNNILNVVSSNLNAIDNSTSSTASYSMNPTADTVSWWGQKTPDQVTADDIRGLITVTPQQNTTVTINVSILPITDKNTVDGYVNFVVTETSVDDTGKVTNSYATPPTNAQTKDTDFSTYGVTIPINKIWSTQSFAGLIKGAKYNYAWVSDSDIANYLQNFSGSTLTANDVWLNMLDHEDYNMPALDPNNGTTPTTAATKIDVQQLDATYGIWKITVTPENVTSDDFVSPTSNVTTSDNQTDTTADDATTSDVVADHTLVRIVRGIGATNSNGSKMILENNANIGNLQITDGTLFDGGTANANVSSLTASEFASPSGGNSALIQLFTNGTGVGGEPLVDLAYAGNQYKIDGSGETIDGQTPTTDGSETAIDATQLNVTGISAIPNDVDGSLQVILTYTTLDVYSNSYVTTSSTLSYPAGTFKTNPNANKDFTFSWKTQNEVAQLGTSYDIVNAFNKNKSNAVFAKLFSNQFFNGTDDAYAQDRDVTIDYVGGSTIDAGGNYGSTSQTPSIVVTLTFEGLSGFTYTSNGQTMQGLQTSATFQLNAYNYQSDGMTIAWNSNDKLFSSNPTFYELTPSDVSQRVKSGTLQDSTFFTVAQQPSGSYVTSYYPDNKDGILTVYVTQYDTSGSPQYLYTQMYTGFKTADDDQTLQYSWIPQDGVDESLLSIPLDQVTKADVINLYLDNISMFSDLTLDDSNVTIIPVTNAGENYLNIQVYIPMWNQSTTGITKADQIFYTNLYGFSQITSSNSTKFNPPKDYTALISITASSIVCVALASVLVAMIARRARIRKFKDDKIVETKSKDNK